MAIVRFGEEHFSEAELVKNLGINAKAFNNNGNRHSLHLRFKKRSVQRQGSLVNRKLERIDRKIKEGKRRLLNAGEALGRHAKYLK